MSLYEILKRIEEVAPKDMASGNLAEMLLYVQEELGEIAECISTEKGYKNKNIKEHVSVECVDAIIGLLGMYFVSGGKLEDLSKLIDKKLSKWEKRVEKYHVRNSWNI